eukprot:832745-Pyramimonas_sp.AAC.1
MAARYWSANMSLENSAGELFEELLTGHNEINLANWLGMPIAGQPADIEFVENCDIPAEAHSQFRGHPRFQEPQFLRQTRK